MLIITTVNRRVIALTRPRTVIVIFIRATIRFEMMERRTSTPYRTPSARLKLGFR